MERRITKSDFLPEMIKATAQAFAQMVSVDVKVVEIHEDTDDQNARCLDITTCMGLTGMDPLSDGTLRGVILLTFGEKLAINLVSMLLGTEIRSIDAEVRDGVGELVNIIAGGTKTQLQEKGIDIGLSIPYTVTGRGHDLCASISKARTRIEFNTLSELFYLDCIF